MAQKTNPIALRRAAGLRRADGAWAARWGYTDLALGTLALDRWRGAWARGLDRAGVRGAFLALPRRRHRVEVLAPADRRGGRHRGPRRPAPATLLTEGAGRSPLQPWSVALWAGLAGTSLSSPAGPLAGLLATRLAAAAAWSRPAPEHAVSLPTGVRPALLCGWLTAAAAAPRTAFQGVQEARVTASATGHWQSATYIAEEVARRLAAGAGWPRVCAALLAPLADHRDVAGLRVRCAGRLAGRSRGAARARALAARWGRTPLHTLRCPVDYGTSVAATGRGAVGVKVWVAYHPRTVVGASRPLSSRPLVRAV